MKIRIVLLLFATSLLAFSSRSQKRNDPKLWAVVGVSEPLVYEDANHNLNITFGLVNDGHETATTGSWKIIINGEEVAESGFIFGNGPEPTGGWGTLPAGGSFILGKALSMGKYFNKPGIYEVGWKGVGFSAKPVIVRVLPR